MNEKGQASADDSDNPILALQQHPIYRVANKVAIYLGIKRDWIASVEAVSLAAGRMAIPFHLDVTTDQLAVDLAIADRLSAIMPGTIIPVDTYKQFHAEEHNGFEGRSVLLVRRDYPKLFQDVIGFASRSIDSLEHAPSIWRITSQFHESAAKTGTLRLLASSTARDLNSFAPAFASRVGEPESRQWLADLLESLCPRIAYSCPFRERIYEPLVSEGSTGLSPVLWLIVERLLQVFANIRRVLSEYRDVAEITAEDYEAVRTLLIHLPLVPVDRVIAAESLKTAERIHAAVHADGYQLALPDQSEAGHHWFTRNQVSKWADLGYTTVKKHLGELEDDGVLVSTVDRNNREHGRVIHYRFANGRSPPFGWGNPFAALPDLSAN